jgi:hypothetical protein
MNILAGLRPPHIPSPPASSGVPIRKPESHGPPAPEKSRRNVRRARKYTDEQVREVVRLRDVVRLSFPVIAKKLGIARPDACRCLYEMRS